MTTANDFNELDEITHTIECPDVYMGALKNTNKELFTFDGKNVKLERVQYNTGLLKIFDEILTNASDNLQRAGSGIQNIMVNIDSTSISIYNDGKTIPIDKNENGIWIPEMIFTHFRSGSNFKKRNKTTGGKNGIGAKLTSVYSTQFEIDITNNGKHYYQKVENNCRKVNPPVIENISSDTEPSITITFKPDFNLLKCSMTDDNKKVLYKRVHDLTHLPLNIYLNDDLLPRLSWNEYVKLFKISPLLFSYTVDRWKISFGTTYDKFRSISYVNNISTYDGGEHVKYILNQVYNYITSKNIKVVKNTFKSKMVIIVSAIIDDPSFTSQAKETLSTPPEEFGSTCIIPEIILSKFYENSEIVNLLQPKKTPTKSKTNRGKITNVEKLVEANKAGTSEGYKCTLFLCEGLSAKTMCDTGIGILGHDYYGCYPLRGKVLNTRNSSDDKYEKNRELLDVKEILGLQDGVVYEDVSTLRYGKVVCVKDADSDGASIMGLVINFFESKFPSLLHIDGFFSEFISPMIKVIYNPNDSRKRRVIPFYNEVEYKEFIASQQNEQKKFVVEFIKGLATNETEDIHEYFNHYDDNKINIIFDKNYDKWLDMAFNSKRTNDRKLWLTTITPDTCLPRKSHTPISVIDFVKSDLVLFSYDNCVRSIPSCVDGLKPSQRKILYTLFKMGNNGYNKMKVFQLGGLVAKNANYHHGDQSMNSTIIGMAQDYPGCGNNIPILKGFGQFGSRIENGEDSGAPRYISCALDKISRFIFPQIDDSLLTIKEEDNQKVEPVYYVPIIPMILVNGAKGIGTGWSTDIPSFNPKEIIQYVKSKILLDDLNHIHSYYKSFDGKITEEKDRWNYHGIIEKINDYRYKIKELPIRYSTSSFIDRLNYLAELGNLESSKIAVAKKKEKADELVKNAKKLKAYWTPNPIISSFTNHSTVDKINFDITFREPITPEEVISALGLVQSIKNTNMVAFDSENIITKFEGIDEIIDEWYCVRYNLYEKRIKKMIDELKFEIKMMMNKCRFIEENIKKIIDVKNIPKATIIKTLEERKYDKLPNKESYTEEDMTEENISYDYLLNMKIYSLTKEKYESLKQKIEELQNKLKEYESLCAEELWINDLDELEKHLNKL